MKVIMEAEYRLNSDKNIPAQITLTEIGDQAWIQLAIGDAIYEIGYREFWNAAQAVCIRAL